MRLVLLGAGASYGASRFGDFRPPLVTGILPRAVDLGLFSSAYGTIRHDAFVKRLRESGTLHKENGQERAEKNID